MRPEIGAMRVQRAAQQSLTAGAVGGACLGPEVIHAELGEVLAGKRSGRTDTTQITIFASVGLAFQDLAAGWLAYTLARQHGFGRSVDLLG